MTSATLDLARLEVALASGVVHFVWQGALIAGVAALALRCLAPGDALGRYVVGCVALGLSALVFALTCAAHAPVSLGALPIALSDAPSLGGLPDALFADAPRGRGTSSRSLAWVWALGVGVMSARLLVGSHWVHRLRTRGLLPVDASVQREFDELRRALGVPRRVGLRVSALVQSPVVVGWFAPLVLVPLSTLTLLTPEQLRSVFAHELAHIRRLDPLVNAAQALIEVVLFFHPAVWWLSRLVRDEREHCCDLAAVRATGGPLPLAQALTRLESLRLSIPTAALAAQPHRGALVQRITRIVNSRLAPQPAVLVGRLVAALAAGALLTGVGVAHTTASAPRALLSRVTSAEGQDAKAEYRKLEERLAVLVEAGWMKPEEAKALLGKVRERMAASAQKDTPAARSEARYRGLEQDVLAAVAAGQVTPEQAGKRLAEARRRLAIARQDEEREAELARRDEAKRRADQHAALTDASNTIEADVEVRYWSPEERRTKLGELRKKLAEADERAAADRTERADAAARIERAVNEGRLSSTDARLRLAEMRNRIAGMKLDARRDADSSAERQNLLRALEAAVKSGQLSVEEAREKLDALRTDR